MGGHVVRISRLRAEAREREELGELPSDAVLGLRARKKLLALTDEGSDDYVQLAAAKALLDLPGAKLRGQRAGATLSAREMLAMVRANLPELERQAAEEAAREGEQLPSAGVTEPDDGGWAAPHPLDRVPKRA